MGLKIAFCNLVALFYQKSEKRGVFPMEILAAKRGTCTFLRCGRLPCFGTRSITDEVTSVVGGDMVDAHADLVVDGNAADWPAGTRQGIVAGAAFGAVGLKVIGVNREGDVLA